MAKDEIIKDDNRLPISNLLGRRFGKLVVEEYLGFKEKSNGAQHYWKCKCDCGNKKITYTSNLTGKHVSSCGCIKHGADLTGQRFGKLVVLKEAPSQKRKDKKGRKKMWECICDCGNKTITLQELLVSGKTRSCGCYVVEHGKAQANPESVTRKYKRLYGIWRGMKNRCNLPNDQHHEIYYDRGIKVCDDWNNSFISFKDWALSHGYNDNLSIDRIDNDKGYSPDNCRWATTKEQGRNKRKNIRYNVFGKQLTAIEVEEIYGINRQTFASRVNRYGYSPNDAATMPLKHRARNSKR